MSYRDTWAECKVCGKKFVYTVELQRHAQASGLSQEASQLCSTCAPRGESGAPQPTARLDPLTGHWVGSIKWFDSEKGYGFIDRMDGTDVFFHKSEIIGFPSEFGEGQNVTYEVEETFKGPQAVEVRIYKIQS